MELTVAIQEALVALLCYDPEGAKLAGALVDPRAYDPYWRDIAEAAVKYRAQYGKPPGEHTLDLFDAIKARRKDSAPIFDRIYGAIEQTYAGINRLYVISQATRFCRHQRLKAAIQKSLELLGQERDSALDEAEAAVLAIKESRAADGDGPGLLLNDPVQALSFLGRTDEYFTTGIAELDKYDLGPVRAGLHLLLALANRGKTWWLTSLGRHNHRRRKKVVHITCEMKAYKVAQRYLQSLFSVSKRRGPTKVKEFRVDDLDRFVGMDEIVVGERPSLSDDDARPYLTRRIDKTLKRAASLYIKEFPTGALTIRGLNAYLDMLEAVQGFIPDLVLLDYVDLMAIDTKNYRHDVGRLYKELRGIAGERNIAVATVTQSNQAGLTAKSVGEGNFSEDFSKNFTCDTILSYSQTDMEHLMGLARLRAIKNRDDVKGIEVLLSQAYNIGQFHYDSVRMVNPRLYWDTVGADAEARENGDAGSDDA